jgi:hypothetical protein
LDGHALRFHSVVEDTRYNSPPWSRPDGLIVSYQLPAPSFQRFLPLQPLAIPAESWELEAGS